MAAQAPEVTLERRVVGLPTAIGTTEASPAAVETSTSVPAWSVAKKFFAPVRRSVVAPEVGSTAAMVATGSLAPPSGDGGSQ